VLCVVCCCFVVVVVVVVVDDDDDDDDNDIDCGCGASLVTGGVGGVGDVGVCEGNTNSHTPPVFFKPTAS